MEFEIVKIVIALLVLVNPLGAIPLFISLTHDYSQKERKAIAKTAAITVAIVIALFALVGDSLLKFLGISLGSFQLAGGLLVIMIALALMNAKPTPSKATEEEAEEATHRANIAVVPMAIPLLTGPGAISTVIIYTASAKTWWQVGSLIVAGLVVAVTSYIAMTLATPISRFLGQTGINIVNRVMGMLLAALSIEIIVAGLYRLFPQLGQ